VGALVQNKSNFSNVSISSSSFLRRDAFLRGRVDGLDEGRGRPTEEDKGKQQQRLK
jgi:hypothetical protein